MAIRSDFIAELKEDLYARVPSDGEGQLLIGNVAIGDMLPEKWHYDASSTDIDDGITVIAPTVNTLSDMPGRWLFLHAYATKDYADNIQSTLQSEIDSKLDIPIGSTSQYVRGDGSLATFPSIPTAQINSDWSSASGVNQILNKPSISTAGQSGDYNDLSNKPTIPTALPPNGSAAGDLTGTYPSPTIAANAVTTTKMADGSVTNAKINSVAYSKVTGTPSFATIATSGSFADLSNKPNVPVIYNNSGVVSNPIKMWAGAITPSTASGQSVDISSAGFSTILSVTATAQANTSSINSIPLAVIKTASTSALTLNIISSQTTVVLLGGNITGLSFASLSGVTVNIIVIGY